MTDEVIALSIYRGPEYGFVFASEGEMIQGEQVYYCVITLPLQPYKKEYKFRVIVNGKVDYLKLINIKEQIYAVEVMANVTIYFKLFEINPLWNVYRGKARNWNKDCTISLLQCLNFRNLEYYSKRTGFYFVGGVAEQ